VNRTRAARTSALLAVFGIAASGCVHRSVNTTPTITTTVTRTVHPHPTKTIVRDYRTYRAGETGVLSSPSQHASIHITVGPPSRSTTRLSPSYGYAPQHGHYVTFRLTIRNAGKVPILIQRLDFWVRTPGAAKTTTDEGNAPYSGSGSQLDTTTLTPGDSVTNDLTFDVANPTGTLLYGQNGHPALAWTF